MNKLLLILFFIISLCSVGKAQSEIIREYEYLQNDTDTIKLNLYNTGLIKAEKISINCYDSNLKDTLSFSISRGNNFFCYILKNYEKYYKFHYNTVIPFSTTASSVQYSGLGVNYFYIPYDGQIHFIQALHLDILGETILVYEFLIVSDYDLVRTETSIFLDSKKKLPIRAIQTKYRKILNGKQLIRIEEQKTELNSINILK